MISLMMGKNTGEAELRWSRGTNDGTVWGTPCATPNGGSCLALGSNDQIDGYFRVYASETPDFGGTLWSDGPDDDLLDGVDDLDQMDQRDHVVTAAELGGTKWLVIRS